MLIAVAIAPGSSTNPVSVAVKPSTFCKNSGSTSAVPNRPNPVMMPITLPALNARDLNTFRSTSGRGSCHSRQQNTTSDTTATAVRITIVVDENQSSRCPRSSTYCTDATPAVSSASPSTSTGDVSRLRYTGSRMYSSVMTNAAMPIGMLM